MSEAIPIELTPPDIECYREGNVTVDYVHVFESDVPGPTVMVQALTHGNEICGALALDHLFKQNVKAVKGSNRFYIIDAFNYGLARVEENGGKPQLVLTIHDKAGVEKYRITLGASDAAVLPPP